MSIKGIKGLKNRYINQVRYVHDKKLVRKFFNVNGTDPYKRHTNVSFTQTLA